MNAGDNKGNVEKWLLQVEHSMTNCLRTVTNDSINDFLTKPREQWVLDWPGMVVICGDMCYWTQGAEEYLANADIKGFLQVRAKTYQYNLFNRIVRKFANRCFKQPFCSSTCGGPPSVVSTAIAEIKRSF